MIVECKDLDRILRDAEPAELAALEAHGTQCRACAQELAAWRSISIAARQMQKTWESPALWPRIEKALEAEDQTARRLRARWKLGGWGLFVAAWRTALATGILIVVAASTVWLMRRHQENTNFSTHVGDSQLLSDSARSEVERAERAYLRAIDKLATEAQPRLDGPATPLLASYREKLIVLDAAIADLRGNIEQNQSNTHLRMELAAMYREKRETLEAVIREE